jgi:hypothetical protein
METWQQMKDRHMAERVALLRGLADQGLSQTDAAKVLGISLSGLNNFVIRYRIGWKVKETRRTKTRNKVLQMAKDGKTRAEVMAELGLSQGSIRAYTQNYKIQWIDVNPRGKTLAIARDMGHCGHTQTEE